MGLIYFLSYSIMSDENMLVVRAMETYGGSFVHALAIAFYHADMFNFERLKNAFPEYWEQYRVMSKTQKLTLDD